MSESLKRVLCAETVTLAAENMHLLGAARFCYPDELQPRAPTVVRSVDVARFSPTEVRNCRIKITGTQLIPLSPVPAERLVHRDTFRIAPLHDAEIMFFLSIRAGWNQTREDIDALGDLNRDGMLCATYRAADTTLSLGTGGVFPLNDSAAWIGMLLVHPEVRRQGIAQAIMEACAAHAVLVRGYRVIGLDATPMGQQFYGDLGYVATFRIWRSRLTLDPASHAVPSTHVEGMTSADLPLLAAYETAKGFLPREQILRSLHQRSPAGGFVFRDGGTLRGYLLSRAGRLRPFLGPLVADSLEVAVELLAAGAVHWHRQGATEAFLDTPEWLYREHAASLTHVMDQPPDRQPSDHVLPGSIAPVRYFARMYQIVTPEQVDPLVEDQRARGAGGVRLETFRRVLERATRHREETTRYAALERDDLQQWVYGISGPEKG